VIIDSSLSKVDELIHLSYRLRRVALQSAVGGMMLSGVGMLCAAAGLLTAGVWGGPSGGDRPAGRAERIAHGTDAIGIDRFHRVSLRYLNGWRNPSRR